MLSFFYHLVFYNKTPQKKKLLKSFYLVKQLKHFELLSQLQLSSCYIIVKQAFK